MTDLIKTIRETFPRKTVAVVGDLVADQFLRGTISRVSREAPVFILRHDETETFAGGAGNAATNVASLGGRAVAVGVVGTDDAGSRLISRLDEAGVGCSGIETSQDLKTTTKVRVLAGQHYAARQQVIRIDYENSGSLGGELRAALRENLRRAGAEADAIVLSDYGYGTADAELAETALSISRDRGIPLIVDSRFRLGDFKGAASATPNQDEVEHILGKNFDDEGCDRLRRELRLQSLLVTCGNRGMVLFEDGKSPLRIDAVGSREPVDVTGAGDTVIAAYSLGLASGLSFAEAAAVANHAGSVVVMKKGTASVSAEELVGSLGPVGKR